MTYFCHWAATDFQGARKRKKIINATPAHRSTTPPLPFELPPPPPLPVTTVRRRRLRRLVSAARGRLRCLMSTARGHLVVPPVIVVVARFRGGVRRRRLELRSLHWRVVVIVVVRVTSAAVFGTQAAVRHVAIVFGRIILPPVHVPPAATVLATRRQRFRRPRGCYNRKFHNASVEKLSTVSGRIVDFLLYRS